MLMCKSVYTYRILFLEGVKIHCSHYFVDGPRLTIVTPQGDDSCVLVTCTVILRAFFFLA